MKPTLRLWDAPFLLDSRFGTGDRVGLFIFELNINFFLVGESLEYVVDVAEGSRAQNEETRPATARCDLDSDLTRKKRSKKVHDDKDDLLRKCRVPKIGGGDLQHGHCEELRLAHLAGERTLDIDSILVVNHANRCRRPNHPLCKIIIYFICIMLAAASTWGCIWPGIGR